MKIEKINKNIFKIIILLILIFGFRFTHANYENLEVNISPEGVIDPFSVSCTGTNATALLLKYPYPFSYSVLEYMRRPCLGGMVTFDSFDLNEYLNNNGGQYPLWQYYYRTPFKLVIKDTTNVYAPDAPIYHQIINLPSASNQYSNNVLDPNNYTYPTLAVGPSFDFNGENWLEYVRPSTPPVPIGDQNDLPAQVSPNGDVPRVSINCTIGNNYTLSLVHRDGDVVSYSYGVLERIYCYDGIITFKEFNLNNLLTTQIDPNWWLYVRTPVEYIIKDTTGLYRCDEYDCPLISLEGVHNNFDRSLYLASSTVWTTVGKGPVFDRDENQNWFNVKEPEGNSSVLFLPGIMGSRLYKEIGSIDCGDVLISNDCFEHNEVWTSVFDSDHIELALNTQGKSINSIYTIDDVISSGESKETGIIDEIFGLNLYKSFISDLREWKSEEIIADYVFIPYDWRLSLEDIITNGATTTRNKLEYTNSQNFSESYILKKLLELQQSSHNGKVTIIAHSNGGLVAKALLQKLKDTNNPLYNHIDKIILVAVPQVGTPDAISALLHGSSIGYGLLMTNQRSRALMENMPSVYNLLPSSGYFTTIDPAFAVGKVISFKNDPLFSSQLSEYGVFVSNEEELKDYILGTDGRIKPAYNDTKKPNIGNSVLYSQAQSVHSMLDIWQPSSTTEIIQIAGWGEETLAGLDYVVNKNYLSPDTISYKPRKVIDGDGTVVVPSALWMSTSTPNIERWWVNLLKYNNPILGNNRIHRDMLEISNLRNFIKSVIVGSNFVDPENIVVNNTSTFISNDTRLHYTLHSPLSLGVFDSLGRYTGLDPITLQIKEEIPGVTYEQIGEVQFISIPKNLEHILKLQGLTEGSFSLDVEKQIGNNVVDSSSFQGIPVATSTVATLFVGQDLEINDYLLNIDNDGDGQTDKSLNAVSGDVVIYDVTPPELQITFDLNTKDVVFSSVDNIDSNSTITFTDTEITLTDLSGNTTIIPFKKFKDSKTKLRLAYNKIIRNGVETSLPNTNIIYDWKEKKGELTDLDTRIIQRGVERYIFNYNKTKNVTIIRERKNSTVVKTTEPGFVVVNIKTKSDGLEVNY